MRYLLFVRAEFLRRYVLLTIVQVPELMLARVLIHVQVV